MEIDFKEVESNVNFTNVPFGGMKLYNPKYRDMPLQEVIKHSRISSEYAPYGYNEFVLVRSTGTIHAYRN
jgi:hypothetical protein